MRTYSLSCLQDDGTWLVRHFRARNDDEAVAYGLTNRTTKLCELHQSTRLVATFDGAPAEARPILLFCGEDWNPGPLPPESETAYFRRRAAQEREDGALCADASSRQAHAGRAEAFEGLARAIDAQIRRLHFHDVNDVPGDRAGRG